jgi:hypothetical protein
MGMIGSERESRDFRHRKTRSAVASSTGGNVFGEEMGGTIDAGRAAELDRRLAEAVKTDGAKLAANSNDGEGESEGESVAVDVAGQGVRLDPPYFGRRLMDNRRGIAAANTDYYGRSDVDASRRASQE